MQLKFGAFSKKCNVIKNTLIIVKKSIKDIYEEIIIVHRTHYRSFFVWPSIYSISMLSKPQIISLKVKQIIIHRICWAYKRKQLEIRCNQINKKKFHDSSSLYFYLLQSEISIKVDPNLSKIAYIIARACTHPYQVIIISTFVLAFIWQIYK